MLDLLDNYILVFIHALVILSVVLHMNDMHAPARPTPKFEIAVWWCIGVGAFGELVFALADARNVIMYHEYETWSGALFAVGSLGLIVLHMQPEWRKHIADRRRKPRPINTNTMERG